MRHPSYNPSNPQSPLPIIYANGIFTRILSIWAFHTQSVGLATILITPTAVQLNHFGPATVPEEAVKDRSAGLLRDHHRLQVVAFSAKDIEEVGGEAASMWLLLQRCCRAMDVDEFLKPRRAMIAAYVVNCGERTSAENMGGKAMLIWRFVKEWKREFLVVGSLGRY